jgi:hypothetical protein
MQTLTDDQINLLCGDSEDDVDAFLSSPPEDESDDRNYIESIWVAS